VARLALLRQLLSRKSPLSIAVAVVAGLGAGLLLLPRAEGPGGNDEPLPEVAFLGQRLNTDDTAAKQALERARRYVAGKVSLELPDGSRREVYLGEIGAEIDKVRLASLVRQAKDRTSVLVRGFRAAAKAGPLTLPVPVALNLSQAVATVGRLKRSARKKPPPMRQVPAGVAPSPSRLS
jgi:hypothetical protein